MSQTPSWSLLEDKRNSSTTSLLLQDEGLSVILNAKLPLVRRKLELLQ